MVGVEQHIDRADLLDDDGRVACRGSDVLLNLPVDVLFVAVEWRHKTGYFLRVNRVTHQCTGFSAERHWRPARFSGVPATDGTRRLCYNSA